MLKLRPRPTSVQELPQADIGTRTNGRVAVLDWDNSLRDGWLILDWAEQLCSDGLFPPSVRQGLLCLLADYEIGRLSYDHLAEAMPKLFAGGLAGHAVDQIASHAERFVARDRVGLRPFARGLLLALNERQIPRIFVSGAPQELLSALLKRHCAAEAFGTVFGHAHGAYTGVVITSRASQRAKRLVADELGRRRLRIVIAVGDSSADIPLLAAADVPVVVGDRDLADTIEGSFFLDAQTGDINAVLERLDSLAPC
jgi:phosphoserine phosphatase